MSCLWEYSDTGLIIRVNIVCVRAGLPDGWQNKSLAPTSETSTRDLLVQSEALILGIIDYELSVTKIGCKW
jgi:hypothetical protein